MNYLHDSMLLTLGALGLGLVIIGIIVWAFWASEVIACEDCGLEMSKARKWLVLLLQWSLEVRLKVKKLLKVVRKHGTIPWDMPAGFRLDKQGELILPKSPGECADLLYRTREARLKLERQAERFKNGETKLREFFVNSLDKKSTGVSGLEAHAQVETKPVPQVEDWDKFYEHVRKTKSFELLQRRLNEGAVKERWENKKAVPGVGVFNAKVVSCTKL